MRLWEPYKSVVLYMAGKGGPGNRPLGPGSGTARVFDEKKRMLFLAKLAVGVPISTAAHEVGVSRQTIYEYASSHEDFQELMADAGDLYMDQMESALFAKALSGDVIALQVVLYNRRPNRWSDRRKGAVISPDAVDEEIKKLEARLSQLEANGEVIELE